MEVRERILAGALVVLGLNSVYLAARADPTLFYFGNVLTHVLLGFAVAVVLARRLGRHWRGLGAGWRLAGVLFGTGSALGIVLTFTGTTRPYRTVLYAHIILLAAATLVALAAGWRAVPVGSSRPSLPLVAAGLLLVTSPFVRGLSDLYPPRDVIRNGALPPPTMDGEGQGPGGPFFPSSAETDVGHPVPSKFFMTSEDCARCHKEIYDQWNGSAHHFASFNNQWYRKSIEYMQDVVGTRPSKWCAGCHDHAVVFAGKFDKPIKQQINSPEAQVGLACASCHSIVHVKSTMGQGDFTIEYPPLHDLAVSKNPILSATHDYLLKLDPGPHKRTFLKSFHREQTPEFCSACHKVHLDVPVNAYRWSRGFNEYDNWQASGISGEGARSFYYPPKPQKCVDCHMPLVPSQDPAARGGKVHSHRFPGANTALPFVNRDPEQLALTQAFLRAGQVTIDIFGLVRGEADQLPSSRAVAGEPRLSSNFAIGEESASFGATQAVLRAPAEVVAPLDGVRTALRRGESARVEVVVRTRKVGHFFPGGTVDAFDVWVELEATDSNGETIFHSGFTEDGGSPGLPGRTGASGPVESGAHFYRALMLDGHGNVINKRNAFAARSVAYVRLIPPGAADTVHYRLRIPSDCGDRILLKARLNYRKFSWWNTQWAFAGVRDPEDHGFSLTKANDDGRWLFTGDTSRVSGKIKAIPDIPTTVMAEASVEIPVLPRDAPLPAPTPPRPDARLRERWNDYGIGLLLQGDLKGAEAAFLRVTQLEPGYADGWVNVGRARLTEGNLAGAELVLRKALEVDPKLAKTHFFLGGVLKREGRYDEALPHLQRASALYPRDRVVLNELGRLLFLKRQYRGAVAELDKVLSIDPEDLQAHYNLMLSYQGLGDGEMAKKHEALYRRFKADESAQTITGPYRQLHPDDNNERQAVHEHASRVPSRPAPSYARPTTEALARPAGKRPPAKPASTGGAAGVAAGGSQ